MANKINETVSKDTNGKITDIVSADNFNEETKCTILHALYIKSQWLFNNVQEGTILFKNIKSEYDPVKSFKFSRKYVPLIQKDGINLIALPMAGDCHIIIRQNTKKIQDLKSIGQKEIADLMDDRNHKEVNFDAPMITMKKTINLKELLADQLENTLYESFDTKLGSLGVSSYIQKLVFELNKDGGEAAAVTGMGLQSCSLKRTMPIDIKINSPFTGAWVKKMNSEHYLMFQFKIIDTSVMKDIDPHLDASNSDIPNCGTSDEESSSEEGNKDLSREVSKSDDLSRRNSFHLASSEDDACKCTLL